MAWPDASCVASPVALQTCSLTLPGPYGSSMRAVYYAVLVMARNNGGAGAYLCRDSRVVRRARHGRDEG